MALSYSLIIPYFKTPEITRFALNSIFNSCRADSFEVLIVDNAPDSPESEMLLEFGNRIKVIKNYTELLGTYANFQAIDVGVENAQHNFVGILHSDTIFTETGWDLKAFGRMEESNLSALVTLDREAGPHRRLNKKLGDWAKHLLHKKVLPKGDESKLMLHFLLTRKDTLKNIDFNFLEKGHLRPHHLEDQLNGVEVLSGIESNQFLWHTSNITSLLTGQMEDEKTWKRYRRKRELLMADKNLSRMIQSPSD